MSISYLLRPVDDEMLAYGADSGVAGLPAVVTAGRWPTVDELIEVLKATPGHHVSHSHHSPSFSITIESLEFVPVQPVPPLKNTTAPASYLHVTGSLSGDSNPLWLSFHGHTDVMLSVIQRLTLVCGPLVFFADCDGLPWFVFSDQSWPLGTEHWQAAA